MTSKNTLFALVVMVACLGAIASDIYTPSLSAIARHFHVSINIVQYTMAIFMLGFAMTQLVYGPVSEVVGRRKPLAIGLITMIVGCVICVFAPGIKTLLLGRFIQGCGAGVGPLFRPIFRDLFKNEELSKYGSYATVIMTFMLSAAPTVGGYLQHYINWQASFVFVIAYSIIVLLLIKLFMHETSIHYDATRARLSFILGTFKEILLNRVFVGYCLTSLISYGVFFSWFVTGPALLIHALKLSPVAFGWVIFICGGVAMLSAAIFNAKKVSKLGSNFMLQLGWSLMIISGILMLAGYYFVGMNLIAIIAPIIIFYFGSTLLWANIFANAFAPLGHIAGYAGAVYSFMQVVGGAALGALMAHLPDHNQLPLAIVMIAAPALALIIYRTVVKP